MPNNENVLAQISMVPLTAVLDDPPPLEDIRLSSWLWDLRRTVEENAEVLGRSLQAVKTAVTETITVITATSYSVTDDDFMLLADATGGPITLNLPPAADVLDQVFSIKRLNSGANSVTIDADGTETIDGSLTKVLGSQYDTLNITSDGTEWWISALAGAGGGGTDDDAIHDNVASEITAITEKFSPTSGDFVIIEDVADGDNKKKVDVDNIGTATVPLALQYDDTEAGGIAYKGEATAGTATSAASWRIVEITTTGPDVVILWADGDTSFNNIWDDRASLSYS